MNPESHEDWLDHVSGPRPDPSEVRRLQSHGVLNPAERRRLTDELALNRLLDAHRPAPAASSNFASRVVAEVSREGSAAARPAFPGLPEWIRMGWRRVLAGGAVAACASLAALALLRTGSPELRLGLESATIAHAASLPGVDAATMADFDAVRRLGAEPRPEDDALILALAQ
ncbi:MAG: hypothetical protein WCR07_08285 [Verrucomicrobiota bacterium]|jgi:hypothetical protein